MKQYLDLMRKVLEQGEDRNDRTGVGTRSLFGEQIKFDLSEGFPAVTTKKLHFKLVVGELLWFINGKTDLSSLRYYMFGDSSVNKKTIWDANQKDYVSRLKASGFRVEDDYEDCGKIYGYLWHYNDQFWNAIRQVNDNPYSRRIMINCWIPDIVNDNLKLCLPPCHYSFQLYVRGDGKLDLKFDQRSQDIFLGGPFNYASYAALLHLICRFTGKEPGVLTCSIGDAHIYHNHFDAIREQLSRIPYSLPTLKIDKHLNKDNISMMTASSFELMDYEHHPEIKAPMAV